MNNTITTTISESIELDKIILLRSALKRYIFQGLQINGIIRYNANLSKLYHNELKFHSYINFHIRKIMDDALTAKYELKESDKLSTKLFEKLNMSIGSDEMDNEIYNSTYFNHALNNNIYYIDSTYDAIMLMGNAMNQIKEIIDK